MLTNSFPNLSPADLCVSVTQILHTFIRASKGGRKPLDLSCKALISRVLEPCPMEAKGI